MQSDLTSLTNELLPLAQAYLDASRSPAERLGSLWHIGDRLRARNLKRPHALGAALQESTRGAITRAIVFRGAKARAIWNSAEELRKEVSGLRSVQFFIDSIALLDPAGTGARLTPKERGELISASSSLSSSEFKLFLLEFKKRVSKGKLGNARTFNRADGSVEKLAQDVRSLIGLLRSKVGDSDAGANLRGMVPDEERSALINLTIAVSTALNRTFLRNEGPSTSCATAPGFAPVYNEFYKLARMTDDRRRSRLRKLIRDSEFSELASLMSALRDDKSWLAYSTRSQRSFSLDS